MVVAGTLIAIAGCGILALAFYGLCIAAFDDGETEPVIAKYTQKGWRGHSKNF